MESLAFFLLFPGGTSGKRTCLPMQEMQEKRFDPWVGKIPLGKEMATHSSVLAWKIPWTEGPGRLVHGVTKSQTWLSMHACIHEFFIHPYPVLSTNSFKAKKIFLNFLNTCYVMEDEVLRLYKKNPDSLSWASNLMGNKIPSLLLIVLSFLRTISERLFTWTTLKE